MALNVADYKDPIRARRDSDHFLGLSRRGGDWLLDQHMTSRIERIDYHAMVVTRRHRNAHCLWMLPVKNGGVVVEGPGCVKGRYVSGDSSVGIGYPDQLAVPDLTIDASMISSHRAHPDHRHARHSRFTSSTIRSMSASDTFGCTGIEITSRESLSATGSSNTPAASTM